MIALDWTSIVLGVLTLIGGCGWIVDRRKHKQEVESLKADNRQKDMNLSKMYVDEFRNNIAYHNLNIIPTFFAKSYHKVAA